MKKTLFIIALFLISYLSYGQKLSRNYLRSIPKKVKTIIIQNKQSAPENYKICFHKLITNNFTIQKDNAEMGYILATRNAPDYSMVRLSIICENNSITINTEFAVRSGYANTTWNTAIWRNNINKPSTAFKEALKFAKSLNDKLIFKK